MDKETIQKLVSLRTQLITEFSRLRDYKNNKNAIMKEVDHARLVHTTIKRLDEILGSHVEFSKNENIQ